METQLIAEELRDKGFITSEDGCRVYVSLNRPISRMEVIQALGEAGYAEMDFGYGESYGSVIVFV